MSDASGRSSHRRGSLRTLLSEHERSDALILFEQYADAAIALADVVPDTAQYRERWFIRVPDTPLPQLRESMDR